MSRQDQRQRAAFEPDPHEAASHGELWLRGDRFVGAIEQLPRRRRWWIGRGVNEASESAWVRVRIDRIKTGPRRYEYWLNLVAPVERVQ